MIQSALPKSAKSTNEEETESNDLALCLPWLESSCVQLMYFKEKGRAKAKSNRKMSLKNDKCSY